jgi:hypothetical protein
VLIRGVWNDYPEKKKLRFDVPADLVEAFEMHYHFMSGNVIRYEPMTTPVNDQQPPASIGAAAQTAGDK